MNNPSVQLDLLSAVTEYFELVHGDTDLLRTQADRSSNRGRMARPRQQADGAEVRDRMTNRGQFFREAA